MTIKATSVLAILAIWGAMIAAVVRNPDAWWALFFAFLATGAVGISAGRRLGSPRVLAIAGIWGGTAAAAASHTDAAWMAVFAFVATGAVVYSRMKRDAFVHGLVIGGLWALVGVLAVRDAGAAWIAIFAFLTAASIANSRDVTRPFAAALAWGAAGAVMLATDGNYWLSPIAFLVGSFVFRHGPLTVPRRFEWDLFDRDKDDTIEGQWRSVHDAERPK